jgi:hypothetical protein
MATLAEYQKTMLDLLKSRASAEFADQHISDVAQSAGLGLLREVAVWWRGFAVESNCPWTAQLLKKLGAFEASVESLYRNQNVSPYVEKAAEQFLLQMSSGADPLIAAMARFELALTQVRQGSRQEYCIEWDRNPELLFQSLKSIGDLPVAEASLSYRTYISREIPELVRCEQVSRPD